MFNVGIETDTKFEWYDLMKVEEVQAAYRNIKQVEDYIVSDIESEWADFDSNSSIDDMVETINLIKNLPVKKQMMFKSIYKEGIHEPLDIARNLKNNKTKYLRNIDEFDEIWETVFIGNKEIAILYN